MIPVLIGLAARAGVPARLRKVAAWGMIALLLILVAVLIWAVAARLVRGHDERIVLDDRSKASIEVLGNQLAAERAAGADKREREAAIANEHAQLTETINAPRSDGSTALDALYGELRTRDTPAAPRAADRARR